MKRKMMSVVLTGMIVAAMAVPAAVRAEQTQEPAEQVEEASAEETAEKKSPEVGEYCTEITNEIENGVLTIRIESKTGEPEGFEWVYSIENKGDATFVDLLTDSTMDGCDYAGSFRAVPDCGDTEDTIRLIHTNGVYVDRYEEFNVKIEDSMITEITGGSEALPTPAEDLATVLEGTWQEEGDGTTFMEISLGENNGLDIVVSDGSGKDGETSYYTMTVYYDAVKNALIYNNGTEHTAEITDSEEAPADSDEEEQGTDTGALVLDAAEGSDDVVSILWDDSRVTEFEDLIHFVKA